MNLNWAQGRARTGWPGRLRKEAGFTVIELLTTMVLLGFGLIAAFSFYSSVVRRTADTDARVNSIAELRVTGERMARDIRESASICSPAPAPSADVLYLSGAPDLADVSGASDCVASRMIVWNCDAGTCTRTEGGGSPVIQADGLSTDLPVFTQGAENTVSIYLAQVPDGREGAITFARAATLRNHCEAGC